MFFLKKLKNKYLKINTLTILLCRTQINNSILRLQDLLCGLMLFIMIIFRITKRRVFNFDRELV